MLKTLTGENKALRNCVYVCEIVFLFLFPIITGMLVTHFHIKAVLKGKLCFFVFFLFPVCSFTHQVNWQQERFQEIISKLGHFLKQAGFKVSWHEV